MKIKILVTSCVATLIIAFSSICYGCVLGYRTADFDIDEANWPWQSDKAWAELVRCDCSPVRNKLLIWLQYQYRDGNNYYMQPGPGYDLYYSITDTNVERLYIEKSHKNINYAKAVFFSKCGDNTEHQFYMEKRK